MNDSLGSLDGLDSLDGLNPILLGRLLQKWEGIDERDRPNFHVVGGPLILAKREGLEQYCDYVPGECCWKPKQGSDWWKVHPLFEAAVKWPDKVKIFLIPEGGQRVKRGFMLNDKANVMYEEDKHEFRLFTTAMLIVGKRRKWCELRDEAREIIENRTSGDPWTPEVLVSFRCYEDYLEKEGEEI